MCVVSKMWTWVCIIGIPCVYHGGADPRFLPSPVHPDVVTPFVFGQLTCYAMCVCAESMCSRCDVFVRHVVKTCMHVASSITSNNFGVLSVRSDDGLERRSFILWYSLEMIMIIFWDDLPMRRNDHLLRWFGFHPWDVFSIRWNNRCVILVCNHLERWS